MSKSALERLPAAFADLVSFCCPTITNELTNGQRSVPIVASAILTILETVQMQTITFTYHISMRDHPQIVQAKDNSRRTSS
jgi:hypothetical protein